MASVFASATMQLFGTGCHSESNMLVCCFHVQVGKLLVFESGAVKLQMGDVLLDVAAGTPCQFRQDVAAVNVNHGQFVFLGDVAQRVVCSPNIDQLIR